MAIVFRKLIPRVALLCVVALFATASAQKKAKPAAKANAPTPTKAMVLDNSPAYRNPDLAIQDRVADLLSRMTLEEKVEQIAGSREREMHVIDPTGTFTDEKAREWFRKWDDPEFQFTAKDGAILRNSVQRYL